jgi:hypothetical protein
MKNLFPRAGLFLIAAVGACFGCGGRESNENSGADGGLGGPSGADASPDLSRTGICTPATEVSYRPTCDNAAATAAVVGRWTRCGGSMPGAPAHDGIEFAVGEDFYFLVRDATGLLARGETDETRGTVRAATGPNCMTTTEIKTAAGSRFWSTARAYDTSPRQLWIYTDPEWDDPQRYTFAGPQ